MKKQFFLSLAMGLFLSAVTSQKIFSSEGIVSAKSRINWVTRVFTTDLSYDCKSADLQMPSGKKAASSKITLKMSQLIQPSLLSLFEDSKHTLSDMVVMEQLTLDQVYYFITHGYKTPDVFSKDLAPLDSTNTLQINNLGKELVRQYFNYIPEKPIDLIPSRAYSGIIIDARGAYPVHGEYVKSEIYPCFFLVSIASGIPRSASFPLRRLIFTVRALSFTYSSLSQSLVMIVSLETISPFFSRSASKIIISFFVRTVSAIPFEMLPLAVFIVKPPKVGAAVSLPLLYLFRTAEILSRRMAGL